MPGINIADEEPLKRVDSITLKLLYERTPAAFSAQNSPHVLFVESGGAYWMFNAESKKHQLIAKDDIFGSGDISHGIYWENDKAMLLYMSSATSDEKASVTQNGTPPVVRAQIDGASLRISKWVENRGILISGTNPFIMKDGRFRAQGESRHPHLPTQSGLLVLDDERYITSGYEDETLRVWSLPEGKLLNEWELGRWYSSRRIRHIAAVDKRLLVSSDGGRIEERSLETGKALWSIRPCRGGSATFHYGSQYRHTDVSRWPPLESLSINEDIYYSCGTRLGVIGREAGEWEHQALIPKNQLPSNIINVETLPGTNLAVLALSEGELLVVDRKKRSVVQTLPKTQPYNTSPVTYIAATHQLLTVGEDGTVFLFQVPNKNSPKQ